MDYEEALLQVTDVLKAHNRYHMNAPDHEQAVKAIREIVTPKGKWQYTTHHARRYRICPFCKCEKEDDRATGWNFCHYCGARMESDV